MKLSSAQTDRACGVLIGSAAGDALGAGYEFGHVEIGLIPEMIGGGLGNFAPGEWTDDTAQAVAIASVAAEGFDLRTPHALDQIAQGFADWYAGNPPDVGIQTSAVLRSAGRNPSAVEMTGAARAVHERSGRSAGNGSLMRTSPVALAYLDDPAALVEAAMAISALTHFQDVAQEACALWCLMIRHTVLMGDYPRFDEIAEWMPNADTWRGLLAEAEDNQPRSFTQNSWSVGALQAAWSAISQAPLAAGEYDCGQFAETLTTVIRIGGDTDTVAAIAGALLGARWGMSAIPAEWRRRLHGWPGLRARQLEELAFLAAQKGATGKYGWPLVDHIDYVPLEYGKPALARHPHDEGVWLSSASALDQLPDDVDVVISLCLTGRTQVPAHVEHLNFRLMDEPDAASNPNLDHIISDIAQTITDLRQEGKSVLVHCVAAHSRTPTAGIAYAVSLGVPLERAITEVCGVLPAARPNRGFRESLSRYEEVVSG